MKAKIKGIEIDCTVEEFKQLTMEETKTINPIRKYKKRKVKRYRQNQAWTEQEIISLTELNRLNKSKGEIAKRLGRTKSSINNQLSRMKQGTIIPRPGRQGKKYYPWTIEEDIQLVKAYEERKTMQYISNLIPGRSKSGCINRIITLKNQGKIGKLRTEEQSKINQGIQYDE